LIGIDRIVEPVVAAPATPDAEPDAAAGKSISGEILAWLEGPIFGNGVSLAKSTPLEEGSNLASDDESSALALLGFGGRLDFADLELLSLMPAAKVDEDTSSLSSCS
jgi:hypothetical protein